MDIYERKVDIMKRIQRMISFMAIISLLVSVFAIAPATSYAEPADEPMTDNLTAAVTYQVKTSVNSSKQGRITATSTVKSGESKTIKAVPASGYYLSDLIVDQKSVGPIYSYTFKDVDKAHTVKAVFSKSVKIMLDAGHAGKYNRSSVYPSYYESDMNWKLQNYLKAELLKYNGFYVGTTRTSQANDLAVYYRGKAASGYNLFLSLHSNASSSSSTDYPLVVTQKGDTNHKLAKKLAKTIQTTMDTKQSYKIWQKLESNGAEYYGVLRGSKSAGTRGMILEHSFHTNLAKTKWLSNNTNLKKMAKNEAKVLASYYNLKLKSDKVSPNTKPVSSAKKKTVSSKQKVKVTVGSLNMRKTYNTSSKTMGLAKKGKVYQLKAKTKNGLWGQIKDNGYWIYLKGYTTVVSSPSSKVVKSNQKVKVTVKGLNIRKTYNTKAQVMGTATQNKVYQLKAKTKNGLWGQIKDNGYWIYLKGYTKKVN